IVLPLVVWLIAGQAFITAHYQVRFGSYYVQSIAQMLYWLTLGYGTGRGANLVGPPYFALVIYSEGDAWPISTFLFPLLVAGLCLALIALWRRLGVNVAARLRRRSANSGETLPENSLSQAGGQGIRDADIGLYVVFSLGLTLTPLIYKGSFGERYHVLYLVAVLLAAGTVLERWWQARDGRWGALIALTGLYVGIGLSWADWVNGVLRLGWPFVVAACAGIACGAGYAAARQVAVRRGIVVGVIGLAVALSLVRGPLHWGQFAPFSPEPRSWILAQIQQQYHPAFSD
ncbi:MAG: hypothetical protein HY260_15125, partial [Chloroflexi bacterium]|nr:hypothetical protein [Chloroflexota bacterium]